MHSVVESNGANRAMSTSSISTGHSTQSMCRMPGVSTPPVSFPSHQMNGYGSVRSNAFQVSGDVLNRNRYVPTLPLILNLYRYVQIFVIILPPRYRLKSSHRHFSYLPLSVQCNQRLNFISCCCKWCIVY